VAVGTGVGVGTAVGNGVGVGGMGVAVGSGASGLLHAERTTTEATAAKAHLRSGFVEAVSITLRFYRPLADRAGE
jgi:hypothetical protein